MLPEVVQAVKGQVEILLDSGVRRGSDVVKAICMGASAVLVGRAYAYGLGAAGQAGVAKAVHVVCTLAHSGGRVPLVLAVRDINPNAEITVRARYLAEREPLTSAGASAVVLEEGEAGISLARHVMERRQLDRATIHKVLTGVRRVWKLDGEEMPSL